MKRQSNREPRSYLFVPGDRPERFEKALASGADAVILDLEDAVAPQDKERARACVKEWLMKNAGVYVRVNAEDTPWFYDDLLSIGSLSSVSGLVVPKATDPRTFRQIASAGHDSLAILPLLESAAGFAAINEIARAERVERLLFGTVDFQVDTGIGGDGEELSYFRCQMTIASRLAGIGTPVDGVTTELNDHDAIQESARRARRFGFGGKLCIHPRQIVATHSAFTPSVAEREWATRVVDAAKASCGSATVVDGEMIDAPIISHANEILAAVR